LKIIYGYIWLFDGKNIGVELCEYVHGCIIYNMCEQAWGDIATRVVCTILFAVEGFVLV